MPFLEYYITFHTVDTVHLRHIKLRYKPTDTVLINRLSNQIKNKINRPKEYTNTKPKPK
jgi:hypothetical protein